jgi:hypothetical protein
MKIEMSVLPARLGMLPSHGHGRHRTAMRAHRFCTDTKMHFKKFSNDSSRAKVEMLQRCLCTDYDTRRFCSPAERARAFGRPISAEQTVPEKQYAKDSNAVAKYDGLFENDNAKKHRCIAAIS